MSALLKLVLAIGAMTFVLSGPGHATPVTPVDRAIDTYGTASAYLQPDRLSIDIDVEGRNPESPVHAYNDLAARLAAVKKALSEAGVDLAREVRTHGLHLHVRQENRNPASGERRRMLVHLARLSMEITRPIDPDDAEAASRFLRQVLAAGAAGFRGLTFKVDETKRLKMEQELEARAIADAKRRASAIAEAADMVLGDPIRIVLGPTTRMSMGRAMVRAESDMALSAAAAPDIAIHSGEGARLTVSVQATYAMDHLCNLEDAGCGGGG